MNTQVKILDVGDEMPVLEPPPISRTTLALFGHLLFYPQRVDDYEEQRSLSHMRKKKPEQNL